MADRNLTAQLRTETKKGAARRLRRAGRIPAVMYGHREPLLLSIDAREFSRKFAQISESTIIHLATGEATYDVLVKDFQANHIVERLDRLDQRRIPGELADVRTDAFQVSHTYAIVDRGPHHVFLSVVQGTEREVLVGFG